MILLSSFKIILAIQGPMQFHRNWRIGFSIFEKKKKKATGILINIQLNLWDLSISIQEYKPYFQISRSLISFSSVLLFSVYKSFTSLIKFIYRHFNLLDDIISRIAFLISLLDRSLQLHRNKIDFCVLILSPATLVNSFISFSCFLVDSSGSYIHTHTHTHTYLYTSPYIQRDHFTFSFQFVFLFFFLSYLSGAVMNSSSENGILCFPDIRCKHFRFLPPEYNVAWGAFLFVWINASYNVEVSFFSLCVYAFGMKRCWILSKAFFLHQDDNGLFCYLY